MDLVTSACDDMTQKYNRENTTVHEVKGISSGQLVMALKRTDETHSVDVKMESCACLWKHKFSCRR